MTIAITVPPVGPYVNRPTILGAMQSAAVRLIGRKPASFFTATTAFELEICDWVNEVAQDVAKYQDWQGLTRIAALAGDGASTTAELPDDYDRQTINSDLQSPQRWAWGYTHFTDLNDFIYQQTTGINLILGGWTIYGDQLQFSPAPSGNTLFPYITKNWAMDTTGVAKPAFTADTDKYVLPERLLTLGLVWRWRENKKLDASGDQEAFIKALDEYAGKDAGSSIIRFGRPRRWGNTVMPYMGCAW